MSRTAQTTSTHKGSLFGMVNIASLIYFFFSLSLSRKLKKGTRKGIFNGHVAAKASALLSFLTLSRHLIIAHTATQSNVCVCLVICTFAPSLCVFDSSFLFLFHFFFICLCAVGIWLDLFFRVASTRKISTLVSFEWVVTAFSKTLKKINSFCNFLFFF